MGSTSQVAELRLLRASIDRRLLLLLLALHLFSELSEKSLDSFEVQLFWLEDAVTSPDKPLSRHKPHVSGSFHLRGMQKIASNELVGGDFRPKKSLEVSKAPRRHSSLALSPSAQRSPDPRPRPSRPPPRLLESTTT